MQHVHARVIGRTSKALLIGTAMSLAAGLAAAHVSISSGPGFADKNQEITFGVGHGCGTSDTYSVRVEIPSSVTSVRVMPSEFGKATIEKAASGLITAVTWQKADADLLAADNAYYKVGLRIRVPNQPFTAIHFPTRQTCKSADGGVSVVDWVAETESPDGGGPEPAPELRILPARQPGWNKFTVPAAVADLSVWFSDALIVWKDSAAYSFNSNIAEQIDGTAGVTKLTSLAANDVIWVKY
ncbi:MAG TPA: YcnI family protein [Polyangiaceae bacterium]|nr:YcnI family protein [Polyangiaceae bacterium]